MVSSSSSSFRFLVTSVGFLSNLMENWLAPSWTETTKQRPDVTLKGISVRIGEVFEPASADGCTDLGTRIWKWQSCEGRLVKPVQGRFIDKFRSWTVNQIRW